MLNDEVKVSSILVRKSIPILLINERITACIVTSIHLAAN